MSEPHTAPPAGLILLSHPEQRPITPLEAVQALPPSAMSLPRVTVEIDMADAAQQAIRSRDWSAAHRTLEQLFKDQLEPQLKQYPGYRVVYLGSSSIPLTLYLGARVHTWRQIEVIPHHHVHRTWGWHSEPGSPAARLAPMRLPTERDRTPGEAVIRVSTSHVVDPQMTRRVVPTPMVEIDIALEQPSEDAFSTPDEMQAVASAFRQALDVLGDQFTGVQRVHLFASVQPGMAFLLGAQISPTMHPAIQTYQYTRSQEQGTFHAPAILLNQPPPPERIPLTDEAIRRAQVDREQLAADLERMKGFATTASRISSSWLAQVLGPKEGTAGVAPHWTHLPTLGETPLHNASVDLDSRTVPDSFTFSQRGAWQLDDVWLDQLARRLADAPSRQQALRLLVLHEFAHRGPQALTRSSSREIGRFPKVLEEVDYQADVWAMLHEYALTSLHHPREAADVRAFFMNMVLIATNTMWAFDDSGPPPVEFQVRRLNRYLIWYWQYLLLERGAGAGRETPLDFVLGLLTHRPVIELAGPNVHTHDERVYFALDHAHLNIPELAIYHQGRLFRHGARADFSLTELMARVRARDGEGILSVLRSAFEQTVR
ncbi:SAVED domain-containing protein [Corallococcus carmarthensis]|uniref:SAVED domain-containing protein n=1 Tax=Corallococcus carmarthensis TaxID=2316728 RepID=A0A3A8K9K7_9BACT|nr:SAVED domain-containing protein [Corallococcus carmarthensis]RKH04690.1 SAVED domain-containing protein [Corallococcus carmarthensis]